MMIELTDKEIDIVVQGLEHFENNIICADMSLQHKMEESPDPGYRETYRLKISDNLNIISCISKIRKKLNRKY